MIIEPVLSRQGCGDVEVGGEITGELVGGWLSSAVHPEVRCHGAGHFAGHHPAVVLGIGHQCRVNLSEIGYTFGDAHSFLNALYPEKDQGYKDGQNSDRNEYLDEREGW